MFQAAGHSFQCSQQTLTQGQSRIQQKSFRRRRTCTRALLQRLDLSNRGRLDKTFARRKKRLNGNADEEHARGCGQCCTDENSSAGKRPKRYLTKRRRNMRMHTSKLYMGRRNDQAQQKHTPIHLPIRSLSLFYCEHRTLARAHIPRSPASLVPSLLLRLLLSTLAVSALFGLPVHVPSSFRRKLTRAFQLPH